MLGKDRLRELPERDASEPQAAMYSHRDILLISYRLRETLRFPSEGETVEALRLSGKAHKGRNPIEHRTSLPEVHKLSEVL